MKEFNIEEFKKEYESGDLYGLEYLKEFIPVELKELYHEVMSYNEIFANGWTIEDLLKMGKKDSYWTERAKDFIKKHNVSKKDYSSYIKYFDEYCDKRDLLLQKLGIKEA